LLRSAQPTLPTPGNLWAAVGEPEVISPEALRGFLYLLGHAGLLAASQKRIYLPL
jgi:hypothetical protein